MTTKNVAQYHPKMLMQMCLGYLKLSQINEEIKTYLISNFIEKDKHLIHIAESWLQCESPIENESSRVLVKFLSKLKIPNETIAEWLTVKYAVYQKTNDVILTYIEENWNDPKYHVGEYIITKTK
jgi:hypothetical protein